MSETLIDQPMDDTDYLYEEFLKTANLCTDCRYHEKAHDTELCKFCLRKGKKVSSFINLRNNYEKSISMQSMRENDNRM